MSPDEPFPPALPAVFQSPIGPAISYSNIRAVTSRAERLLDQLDKKVRRRLQSGANDSGMVGAMLESKVRQRLADQLAPAENLLEELTTLVQNTIAGNLAYAVATLEDLQGSGASSQSSQPNTETALVRMPGVEAASPPANTPLTPSPSKRAVGIARQLSRATGHVAGGPPPPAGRPCDNVPDAAIEAARRVAGNYERDILGEPNNYPLTIWFIDPNCCVAYRRDLIPSDPFFKCVDYIYGGGFSDASLPDVATLIVNTLHANGVPTATSNCQAVCPTGTPVDCKVHPLDPSCPVDCKTHPEDPRCPPTPPTCPPPCIEVTCPPPIINVPPCPKLEPTSCVQIDLCDYDKFCKLIKDCLVKAKEDCALDNDTAYTFKDCDGQYGEAQKNFLSGAGGTLFQAQTIDDLATAGMSLSTSITSDEFGLDKPY